MHAAVVEDEADTERSGGHADGREAAGQRRTDVDVAAERGPASDRGLIVVQEAAEAIGDEHGGDLRHGSPLARSRT
jgi:hypothetical protein